MKKIFAMMAIAAMASGLFTSCSSDDDDLALSESSVTLKSDETKTLKASGSVNTWKSENEFVATVDASGVVTAKHVGETYIVASGNGGTVTCKVTVEGKYEYYIEPLCKRGATKSDVKKFERRTLKSESNDVLIYTGESSAVSTVTYTFDDSGKLNFISVLLPHYNSTTLAKLLTNFLLERYQYVSKIEDAYAFMDGYNTADATKFVYLESSPSGYKKYMRVIYAPYEKE